MRLITSLAVLLLLAGCAPAPALDREGLRARGDALAAELRELPDVLDAVVVTEKPGENSLPMFVRLDYDSGEPAIIDAIVAVRETMAASDFELFSLEVQIDDAAERPEGATIQWSGLPEEAELRADAALWFDLAESTPLHGLSYRVTRSFGSEAIVRYTRAVTADGGYATADEVEAALAAAWAAAGREPDGLTVAP